MSHDAYRASIASVLGVDPAIFMLPGASVHSSDERRGTRLASHYRVGEHSVVWCDPEVVESVLELDGRPAPLDTETLARHYEEHVGKGFYDELVAFMSRGPVVAMVIEGPEDTWEVVRAMMGATNPRTAAPGTIRGDLGILFTENLVHGSDSLASAEREIGIFFPNL